jgi:peptidyl-prolyl cis-trans isomerase B (cyclophilin B)
VHKDSTFLDKQYTAFGRLITQESFDVLDRIAALETNHDPTSGAPADSPLIYDDAEIHSIKIINYSEVQNPLTLAEPERIIPLSTIDENNNYSTKLGFSFHIPEGWTVQEPPKSQPRMPDVVAIGPVKDGFTPAISFLSEDRENETLNNHVETTRKDIQKLVDEGRLKILSDTTKNINGYNAHITEAKANLTSPTQSFTLMYKEIVLETDEKFFTLTFVDQEKNFDTDLKIFDTVLKSFETTQQKSEQITENDEMKESEEISKSEQTNNDEQIKSEESINFPPAFAIGIVIAAIASVAVIIVTKMKNKPKSQNSTPQSE